MLLSFGILLFIMPSNKKRETCILFGIYFICKAFLSTIFIQSIDISVIELEYFRGVVDTATTTTLYFGFFSLIFPLKRLFIRYVPLIATMLAINCAYTITLASYNLQEQQEIAKVLWSQPEVDYRFPAIFYLKDTMGLFAIGVIVYFQLLILILGFKFKNFVKNNYSYNEQINLKFFIYLEAFLLSSILMDILIIYTNSEWAKLAYILYTSAFAFSVYYLIANDRILENNLFAEQFLSYVNQSNHKFILNQPYRKNEEESELNHEPKEKHDLLRQRLIQHFKKDKPYISKRLSINDIAKSLNTNRTYVSQIINNDFKTSFFHFVNVFRIEEAKKQISAMPSYSMKTVADSSGFSSYTTFIKYYKMYRQTTIEWYTKEISFNNLNIRIEDDSNSKNVMQ